MHLRREPLRARSPGGFRTVWLNIYGWSAFVAAGLAIGAVAGLLTPLPLPLALGIGVVGTWGLLLVFDRTRYLNSTVRLGDDRLDAQTGAAIVGDLAAAGISASYEEFTDEDEEGIYSQRAISCRQRDVPAVQQMMRRHLEDR